jgi:hypothetical protein
MPWENTEQHIRSGHRDPEEFQKGTLKTVTLDEKEGDKKTRLFLIIGDLAVQLTGD